jgi:hypothetical protein
LLERRALCGEGQEALAAVALAGADGHEALCLQFIDDAAERLFRDAKELEKLADGKAGTARDEVERTVMRAAEWRIGEEVVGGGDQLGIAEVNQLNAAAHLVLAQELRGGRGR